ncbi:D-ribose pyranase [Enterocloster aldenensis]|jgi:D-ribose pyranase|nr:D-ribose pyranase [Enterocloster aldenensis]
MDGTGEREGVRLKKIGLLHGELSRTIAELAHEDIILIGDAGMPVPEGVKLIDLAVVCGVPSFIDVLKAVMSEMLVAKGIIDMEQEEVSPQMGVKIREAVGKEFPLEIRPHAEVKELSKKAKAVIRTGEFTPYSNIILEADCLF